jgi:hypothetical protein
MFFAGANVWDVRALVYIIDRRQAMVLGSIFKIILRYGQLTYLVKSANFEVGK